MNGTHMGKHGDYASSFQCFALSPNLWEHTGGQNLALCPALHNHRKPPLGKDPNVKTLSFLLHFGVNKK